ncbi:MAG TPA: GNAT family N-acetyltransferase [Pseudolabrys sp.]|nr:GNAT family N-acetyltransferase [Pseudolabrys sp.]
MSSIIERVPLIVRATGDEIDAEIRHPIEESNLHDWETKWKPIVEATEKRLRAQGIPRAQWPQDLHWDWRKKMTDMRGLLSGATFTIECEKATQGMMAVNVSNARARIEQQNGQHLVYVEYLEAAPWNRKDHMAAPRFRGVGSILIITAIALSRSEDFKGRIGLHSLPQADEFYTRCGMTDLGADPKYYNLRYFEMTPEQATKFLEGKEKS